MDADGGDDDDQGIFAFWFGREKGWEPVVVWENWNGGSAAKYQ